MEFTEFEKIPEEEVWEEVSKKKITPIKKPSQSNNNRKHNGNKDKSYSLKSQSTAVGAKDSSKAKSDPLKGNKIKSSKADAAHATAATLSTPTKSAAVVSKPAETTDETDRDGVRKMEVDVDVAEDPPSVTDSGVKRGYSSIVSALAAKLPQDLPVVATTTEETPLSVFEFCMRCHNPGSLQTPEPTALVTRGLINQKSDCFQNCILQALFALPHFRRLVYSFHENPRLNDALPLWSELLNFGRYFLVDPADLETPSLHDSASRQQQQKGGRNRSVPAVNKDCLLASKYMPRLCSSFDDLVHRHNGRESSESNILDDIEASPSRLAAAIEQLHLSGTVDTTATATAATSTADANKPLSLAEKLKLAATSAPPATSSSTSSRAKAARSSRSASASTTNTNYSQQDAMEYMTFVLDALHEEMKYAASSISSEEQALLLSFIHSMPLYSHILHQLTHATVTATANSAAGGEEAWSTVRRSHGSSTQIKQVTVDAASKAQALSDLFSSSIIPRLCHGLLRSEVIYKTKKACSITYQKFHCLTLHVRSPELASSTTNTAGRAKSAAGAGTAASGMITVENALRNYFAEESLDSESLCKQSRFEVLPEILILHIGRFAFDYRLNQPMKMHTSVEYSHVLSIPVECLSESLSSQYADASGPRYQLHAVVLHHGKKATGGHYTTYIRASSVEENADWRNIDDNKITGISASQALNATERVYLLFYVRIQ